jgi:carboxyl-terminal processing protease
LAFALIVLFFGMQLPGLLAAPETAVSQKTPSVSVESLSDAEVDAALESIWLKSSRDGVRKPETARRAALDAYVRGKAAGAKLVARGKTADEAGGSSLPDQAGFHAEVLTSKIGYVRIAGFEAGTMERLDRALSDFRQLDANRIVLDLRFGAINGDLEQAARLASRFVPKGTELFSVREVDAATDRLIYSETEPGRIPSMLWVLISRLTAGPAEVLAACLKLHGNATLVGEPTKAELSEYRSIDLNERVSLKVPVRDPVFPGISAVAATGILPDVPVNVSLQETLATLRMEANVPSVSALLREPYYSRNSEQTLV